MAIIYYNNIIVKTAINNCQNSYKLNLKYYKTIFTMKQSILVTGGAGFVGSHLVDYLLFKKNYVVVIDKLTYAGSLENLELAGTNKDFVFLKEDICNTKAVYKALHKYKIQTIYHLAGESHVDNSIEDSNPFIQSNILGTYSILQAGLKYWENKNKFKNFRFIHASTDEVFGELIEAGSSFTEKSPYAPNSPYSASKASADHLVRAWFRTYDFPSIITRSSNNYGIRQHREKFIPTIISNAIQNKPIPIYGNGENSRNWLYVKDHCKGLYLALKKGKLGDSYNFASNVELKNIDVAKYICNILDELAPMKNKNKKSYFDKITFTKDRRGHDCRYSMCFKKAETELGYTVSNSFFNHIKSLINYYANRTKQRSCKTTP